SRSVDLTANFTDQDAGDVLVYTWTVPANSGTITGQGKTVTWDLSGVAPGTYEATVDVTDGIPGHNVTSKVTVTVANCTNCKAPCPPISVSCPANSAPDTPITFTASVGGGMNVTYNWTVSAGTISSGPG